MTQKRVLPINRSTASHHAIITLASGLFAPTLPHTPIAEPFRRAASCQLLLHFFAAASLQRDFRRHRRPESDLKTPDHRLERCLPLGTQGAAMSRSRYSHGARSFRGRYLLLAERLSIYCANLSCILRTDLQPRLKVFGLNAEGFLKILGTQKLLSRLAAACCSMYALKVLICS